MFLEFENIWILRLIGEKKNELVNKWFCAGYADVNSNSAKTPVS
jgi:hypothetical protein